MNGILVVPSLLSAQLLNHSTSLLAQGNPDPKPRNHLHKHEGEEETVLEAIKSTRVLTECRVSARIGEAVLEDG